MTPFVQLLAQDGVACSSSLDLSSLDLVLGEYATSSKCPYWHHPRYRLVHDHARVVHPVYAFLSQVFNGDVTGELGIEGRGEASQ